MSHSVSGTPYFDERAKEILRKMIWQVADFSGVEVLTYCVMSNHFHVLVRVPVPDQLSDAELLRRYRVLYPKPTKYPDGGDRGDGKAVGRRAGKRLRRFAGSCWPVWAMYRSI